MDTHSHCEYNKSSTKSIVFHQNNIQQESHLRYMIKTLQKLFSIYLIYELLSRYQFDDFERNLQLFSALLLATIACLVWTLMKSDLFKNTQRNNQSIIQKNESNNSTVLKKKKKQRQSSIDDVSTGIFDQCFSLLTPELDKTEEQVPVIKAKVEENENVKKCLTNNVKKEQFQFHSSILPEDLSLKSSEYIKVLEVLESDTDETSDIMNNNLKWNSMKTLISEYSENLEPQFSEQDMNLIHDRKDSKTGLMYADENCIMHDKPCLLRNEVGINMNFIEPLTEVISNTSTMVSKIYEETMTNNQKESSTTEFWKKKHQGKRSGQHECYCKNFLQKNYTEYIEGIHRTCCNMYKLSQYQPQSEGSCDPTITNQTHGLSCADTYKSDNDDALIIYHGWASDE